jgi:hypothetical protein
MIRHFVRKTGRLSAIGVAILVFINVGPAILFARQSEDARSEKGLSCFVTLAPGLEYRHEARAEGPLSIHILRIDLAKSHWEFEAGLGKDTVFGLEPLDGIVCRTERNLRKTALAAINGDFFEINSGPYQGDPRGIQVANGELISRPNGNSFWIAADGTFHLGAVASKLRVIWPREKVETPFGLNESRPDDAVVLYTPTLGIALHEEAKEIPGTRTQDGRELVLERVAGTSWLPLKIGRRYSVRVKEIRETGNTPLSSNTMILSIGRQKITSLPPVKVGDVLQLAIDTDPDLRDVKTALGAGRILMREGNISEVGPADQPRHPRSLIGWNQKYFYFMVIDGRQKDLSIGMTYPEMACLARQYDCSDAIEMDGGGSSTIWTGGKILNSPSDGQARAIANGLILFRRGEKSDNSP